MMKLLLGLEPVPKALPPKKMLPTQKFCPRCQEVKSVDCFGLDPRREHTRGYCRKCESEKTQERKRNKALGIKPVRERDIEDYLVKKVEAMGGDVRKVRWIGRRGAPDRLVMLPGIALWVELKAPGKKPEAHQEREHARMRAMGQRVEVVDSFARVEEVLA